MRQPVLLPAVVLAMMLVAPVAAQDDIWTPLAFSGDDVVFVLGGPETRDDTREISLAIVPPEGFVGFGEEVRYVLNFYALNCAERTSRHHTLHVFGKDGNILSIQSLDQPDEAVPSDGSAMDLTARLKCYADPPSVTGGVEQSRLIETANALRGATRG